MACRNYEELVRLAESNQPGTVFEPCVSGDEHDNDRVDMDDGMRVRFEQALHEALVTSVRASVDITKRMQHAIFTAKDPFDASVFMMEMDQVDAQYHARTTAIQKLMRWYQLTEDEQ